MRSLSRLLLVVGVLCVLPFSVARAGSVSIYPQLESGGPGSPVYGLYVENSLGVDIGAVDILVQGATGFSFDPSNLNISLSDSGYYSEALPPYDALIVNGVGPSPTLFATIAPAGATTRLGSFTGVGGGFPPVNLFPGETLDPASGDPAFLGSFFDNSGQPFIGVYGPRVCGDPGCEFGSGGFTFTTVPEPVALPLAVVFGLAVYVLGGKIRRRNGSVGAPT